MMNSLLLLTAITTLLHLLHIEILTVPQIIKSLYLKHSQITEYLDSFQQYAQGF